MVRGAVAALLLIGSAPASGGVLPRALVETVDIGNLAVSPDGRWLAFRTEQADPDRNRYRLDWYVVPTDRSLPPRRVGDGGEPLWSDAGAMLPAPAIWEPGSRTFVFRALVMGAVGLWRAAVSAPSATMVVRDAADIRSFAINPTTGQISYRVGATRQAIIAAEDRDYARGVLVDGSVDLAQGVYHGAIINGRHATQRFAGKWFAREGLLAAVPEREVTVGNALSDLPGSPPTPTGITSDIRSFDGRIAAVADRDGGRCVALGRRSRPAGRSLRATIRCFGERIALLAWWPGRDVLLVATQDRGYAQTLANWAVDVDRVRVVARSPGLLAGSAEPSRPCALSPPAAFCVAARAGAPPRLVRLDRRDGEQTIVSTPVGFQASGAE